MTIISHALATFESEKDRQYPIVTLHKFQNIRTIDGVASGSPIAIKYAIVFRAEFANVGDTTGPTRNIYFKILPKGFAALLAA